MASPGRGHRRPNRQIPRPAAPGAAAGRRIGSTAMGIINAPPPPSADLEGGLTTASPTSTAASACTANRGVGPWHGSRSPPRARRRAPSAPRCCAIASRRAPRCAPSAARLSHRARSTRRPLVNAGSQADLSRRTVVSPWRSRRGHLSRLRGDVHEEVPDRERAARVRRNSQEAARRSRSPGEDAAWRAAARRSRSKLRRAASPPALLPKKNTRRPAARAAAETKPCPPSFHAIDADMHSTSHPSDAEVTACRRAAMHDQPRRRGRSAVAEGRDDGRVRRRGRRAAKPPRAPHRGGCSSRQGASNRRTRRVICRLHPVIAHIGSSVR